jgi:hypothetical protein
MKVERYILSQPYKPFVFCFDGAAVCLSIGKFYFRFSCGGKS